MARNVVTVKQMQLLDKITIKRIGIPSVILMENAGRAVAFEALKFLRRSKKRSACVICGLGNNAGDGFVAARHLFNAGIKTDIFILGSPGKLKKDALLNYKILKKQKIPVKKISRVNGLLSKTVSSSGVVIDAIFGVGLTRAIEGLFKDVIDLINKRSKYTIAVDIPSGLNGNTGEVYGICVSAKKTVTFAFAKKGMFEKSGPKNCGKIVVADIGIPNTLFNRIKS